MHRHPTGLYITSPHESSHPEDNWGFVVTYLNSVSRSNTTASIKNVTTTTAAAAAAASTHAAESARRIFAFRAISDEIDDPTTLSNARAANNRSRHLHHTVKTRPVISRHDKSFASSEPGDEEEQGCMSSKQKVKMIVELLRECCIEAGAFDPDDEEEQEPFVTQKTVQR